MGLCTLRKQLPGKAQERLDLRVPVTKGYRIFKENGGGKIIMTASIKYLSFLNPSNFGLVDVEPRDTLVVTWSFAHSSNQLYGCQIKYIP